MNQKKVVIGILAVLALVAIGVFVWQRQQTKQAAVQNQVEQESFVKTDALTDIDTSYWKTYRNEEYGFELKYPKDGNIEMVPDLNQSDQRKFLYVYAGQIKNPIILSVYSKQGQTEEQRKNMVVFSNRYHEQYFGTTAFRIENSPFLNEEAGAYEITSWIENTNYHFFFKMSDEIPVSNYGKTSEEYAPVFPTRKFYAALLSTFQVIDIQKK